MHIAHTLSNLKYHSGTKLKSGSTRPTADYRRRYNVCVRVQCRQIPIQFQIPRVGADLPAACRQVAFVECGPVIGADCRPVAVIELRSEDAALLLIASENVHLKLKRERGGVHEINQSRGHYGEYHHLFPQLKADAERFFQYFRMDIETFTYILGKTEDKALHTKHDVSYDILYYNNL